MQEEGLVVDGLESGYGEMQVLWGVSLRVKKASMTVVLGPNGAGKTTLLRTIMGVNKPWKGRIVYEGEDITMEPPHKKVEKGITLVPEGRRLFPDLTVEENLLLGAYTRMGRGEDYRETLRMVYELFPILGERKRQKSGTLSGGEQQMLAIGRALMSSPRLLLLDEPSQGLAPKVAIQIVDLLSQLKERTGMGILLVEQNVAAALRNADYAYVMEQGSIIKEGGREEILADEGIKRAYLGL